MSFGPFLGGKRICLGKTFAESMAKSILTIIVSQLRFEFLDQIYYDKKPDNGITSEEANMQTKVYIEY